MLVIPIHDAEPQTQDLGARAGTTLGTGEIMQLAEIVME
jgi:hypothetical protein